MAALGATIIKKDLASDPLSDIPDDFDYDLKANAIGAGRLIAQCKKTKALLNVSTTCVYQYADYKLLDENAPLGDNHRALFPTYSISKIAQETVARFAAQEHCVPLTRW